MSRRSSPGLWAVVVNGFAAAVTILALLLAGAAANLGSPVLLTAAAVVLIAGRLVRARSMVRTVWPPTRVGLRCREPCCQRR